MREGAGSWATCVLNGFLATSESHYNLAGGLAEEAEEEEEITEGGEDHGHAAGVGNFPPDEVEEGPGNQAKRAREVARLVEKLHLNLGHLSKERMVVMLKAAGAREDVLEYVQKQFECETCDRRQREVRRRVAAYPRTFTFNRIVAVDTVYVPWRGVSLPVLNVVDHGSHYQMMTLIRR